MPQLHTVFIAVSTFRVTTRRLLGDHNRMATQSDSYARLTQAFAAIPITVDGPTALASELDESVQTITNWAKRGVSLNGALKCQQKFGINAVWVLNGEGPKFIETRVTQSQSVGLDSTRLALMIECLEGAQLDANRQLDPSRKARILALLYADPGIGNTREAVQSALRVAFMAMG